MKQPDKKTLTPEQGFAEAERRIEKARVENAIELDLSRLLLTALPEWLGQFTQLQSLDISSNELTALPEWLGQLTQLHTLNLIRNQLTALPESLSQLTQLRQLIAHSNQFHSLPEVLGKLSQLEILHLGNNPLNELSEILGNLRQLRKLHVDFSHRLNSLPDALGRLTKLNFLDASSNKLTALPESLGQLTQLQSLDLSNNQLTALPESLASLAILEHLDLAENKLVAEQKAVYDRGGWQALRRYLLELQDKGEDAWVGKLVFVGNGEVGKSCLLDALRDRTPNPKRGTTHGMVRECLHLKGDGTVVEDADLHKIKVPEIRIDFHCWDMGGQDAYRSIHQIFFTPDALYVLAYHGRHDIGRGEVRKWLTLIRNRATSRAKVLLVATNCGKTDPVTPPALEELDADLRNMIVDFIAVDSFEPHHIKELRELLAARAQENDYFKRRLLGGWHRFQKVLEKFKRPYADLETVIKDCHDAARLSRKSSEALLQLGHDCGLLLWHHQNEEMGQYVVLHPDWLSQAIAYVLKYEPAQKTHGVISHAELSELWANPKLKDSKPYPKTVHPMLVALMEDNEISYRLNDGVGGKGGQRSLIAQLVDMNPPKEWRTRWEAKANEQHSEMVRLFCFIPPKDRKPQRLTGLMYRLIVNLHNYSLGKEDYQQAVHWQNGLLVQNKFGDLARIEFRDDDELEIRVRGLIPVSFMDRLREILRQVVGDFWQGVEVRESAICGEYCPSGFKTGAFDVDECLDDLKDNVKDKKCTVRECRKKVSLLSLLNPPAEPQEIVELRKIISARFDTVDAQMQKAQQTLEAFGTQMSTFQRLVRDDIHALMTNLMDDGHDGPRLFCVRFLEPGFWDKPKWVSTKLQVTLCCEYSRLPLPWLDKEMGKGVYQIDLTREWFQKSRRWLLLSGKLVLYFKTLGIAGAAAGLLPAGGLTPELEKSIIEDAETVQKLAEKLEPDGKDSRGFEQVALSLIEEEEGNRPDYLQNYGQTMEKDSSFAHWLRKQIKAQDEEFAGLKKVRDITGKVLWVYEQFRTTFEKPAPSMK